MIHPRKVWTLFAINMALLLSLASASAALEIVLTSARTAPGEQVRISIDLQEATGTAIASFSLQYDATQLTLQQTAAGDLGEHFDLAEFSSDIPGQFNAGFLSAAGLAIASGSLVVLTFAIADQALPGTLPLSLSAIEFRDKDAVLLATSAVEGQILIEVPEPVVPAPLAQFTASLDQARIQEPISFTNESTGEISSLEWDFGDGTTSTEPEPNHIFQSAGTFAVTLTASGPGGSDTHSLEITITAAETNVEISSLTGDFTGDGVVNFSDFFIFSDHFGGTDPRFDLDSNGSVDFGDFFIFADHFGKKA